jgi:hypothetical protein
MSADPTPIIAALDIQPTYSAREAAVLLGRSYSWLDQRLRQDQFIRPEGRAPLYGAAPGGGHSRRLLTAPRPPGASQGNDEDQWPWE